MVDFGIVVAVVVVMIVEIVVAVTFVVALIVVVAFEVVKSGAQGSETHSPCPRLIEQNTPLGILILTPESGISFWS